MIELTLMHKLELSTRQSNNKCLRLMAVLLGWKRVRMTGKIWGCTVTVSQTQQLIQPIYSEWKQ